MRIATVSLSGQRQVSREEIFAAAGVTDHSSLLFLDVADARARLEAIPWIAEATVRKLYPDRLQITVTEREAFALWQQQGKVKVIAADGTVLVRESRAAARLAAVRGRQRRGRTSARLPRGARPLSRDPRLGARLDPRRRPALESAAEERRRRAPAGNRTSKARSQRWRASTARRTCSTATSRRSTCGSPTALTVRLSDAAAQAREDALKKATKKKGGDA